MDIMKRNTTKFLLFKILFFSHPKDNPNLQSFSCLFSMSQLNLRMWKLLLLQIKTICKYCFHLRNK